MHKQSLFIGKNTYRVAIACATVILALTTSTAVASNLGGQSSAATKSPYAIGLFTDYSGSLAAIGNSSKVGLSAYINAVNKKGGVNGHPINVSYLDDQSQVDRASVNFTQFMASKRDALAVVGGNFAATCLAIATLAEANGVPDICYSVTPSVLASSHFTYGTQPAAANQARPALKFAQNLLGTKLKTVGILTLNTPTSNPYGANLKTLASGAGLQVSQQSIDVTNTDPTVQIAQLLGNKPDVIFTNALDIQATKLLQVMRQENSQVPIIHTGGALTITAMRSLQYPNLYVLSPFSYVPSSFLKTAPATIAKLNKTIQGLKGKPARAKQLATLRVQLKGLQGRLAYAQDVAAVKGDPSGPNTLPSYLQAKLIVAAVATCKDECTAAKVNDAFARVRAPSVGLSASTSVGFGASRVAVEFLSAWRWNVKAEFLDFVKAGLKTGSV